MLRPEETGTGTRYVIFVPRSATRLRMADSEGSRRTLVRDYTATVTDVSVRVTGR